MRQMMGLRPPKEVKTKVRSKIQFRLILEIEFILWKSYFLVIMIIWIILNNFYSQVLNQKIEKLLIKRKIRKSTKVCLRLKLNTKIRIENLINSKCI